MADKLLPPIIESKLPAQVGDTITIPYLQNSTIGPGNYNGMVLKIKTVNTDIEKATIEGTVNGVFSINTNLLTVGQYYKAQLAYKNGDSVGYFSSVGIFKYTAEPKALKLYGNNEELVSGQMNPIGHSVSGLYEPPINDPTEKLYSYCFNLYKNDQLFDTTGELIHNTSNDDETRQQKDIYKLKYLLNSVGTYKIEYKITTTNGLVRSSGLYDVFNSFDIDSLYSYDIKTNSPEDVMDSGVVQILLENFTTGSKLIQGNFRLIRSKDNGETFEIIKEFVINQKVDTITIGADYTVEQGVEYIYGVYQYNNTLNTAIVWSDPISVDFEDIFLYDGEKQLKIKFNPKISSFKTNVLESKTDTIGGRFPFVFRNGRTNYKEFPINGLISYLMDNEEAFMTNEELRLTANSEQRNSTNAPLSNNLRTRTTNLTGNNFAAERTFKLAVMDWLNNGKPKLFRSPAEGNYLVRLINISLSPEEKLGRMLHNFSATAYEIGESSYESLVSFGLIKEKPIENESIWSIESSNGDIVESLQSVWVRLYGEPKTQYELTTADLNIINITIGATRMYETIFEKDNCLIKIERKSGSGNFEYAHEEIHKQNFPIKDSDGKIVQGIKYNTKVSEYESDNQITIIDNGVIKEKDDNGDITQKELYNILFLRLETKPGSTNSQYKIGDNETITFTANSRIIYTSADFDGKFIPRTLTCQGVRADIAYMTKEIILEGEQDDEIS